MAKHKCGDCQLYQAHLSNTVDSLHFSAIPSDASSIPDNLAADNDQAKLMQWPLHLGHLPLPQLHVLAVRGEIPKHLAKVKPPFCTGCAFGGMTMQPSRHKGEKKKIMQATKPGEVVSVDQLESTELEFFAQAKGRLTLKRYCYATVFVDHFSCLK